MEEKAVVLYYDTPYGKCSPTLKRKETWTGKDKESIFQDFYKAERRLRYCNGCYHKFEDPNVEKEYEAWYKSLDDNTKFHMYYGNSTVD